MSLPDGCGLTVLPPSEDQGAPAEEACPSSSPAVGCLRERQGASVRTRSCIAGAGEGSSSDGKK